MKKKILMGKMHFNQHSFYLEDLHLIQEIFFQEFFLNLIFIFHTFI
jgi:hypothetical protein